MKMVGRPTDNPAVVLGLNVILDFFHTAANIVCGQFMLNVTALDVAPLGVLANRKFFLSITNRKSPDIGMY